MKYCITQIPSVAKRHMSELRRFCVMLILVHTAAYVSAVPLDNELLRTMVQQCKQDGWNSNSSSCADMPFWDTSQITDMRFLFKDTSGSSAGANSFNLDLSRWDTSRVTSMAQMFYGASSFNGDISRWNIGSVQSLESMFRDATSFNGELSDWDTSRVTDMSYVFEEAVNFNGDLSRWDVSSAVTMQGTFFYANSFNSDISKWNTTATTDFGFMFEGTSFNGDISKWNTSRATDMVCMFHGDRAFNSDISRWDVSNVHNLACMFDSVENFNVDISRWDTSKVTDFESMFYRASSFNVDISGWNTSSAASFDYMFTESTAFNQNIAGWDISGATSATWMFRDAASFNIDLCSWSTNSAFQYDHLFVGSPKLSLCDVNECFSDSDNCSPSAMCSNTKQGFTCACQEGLGEFEAGALCTPWGAPESAVAGCQEDRTWRSLAATFDARGSPPSMVTGGLGRLLIEDRFEAWACFRGHPCLADPRVNTTDGDYMCFVFDEQERKFVPWGTDSELHLVGATSTHVRSSSAPQETSRAQVRATGGSRSSDAASEAAHDTLQQQKLHLLLELMLELPPGQESKLAKQTVLDLLRDEGA